jgi:15,16-dihydrobiliverdin:ferredoxin oxidoreductase
MMIARLVVSLLSCGVAVSYTMSSRSAFLGQRASFATPAPSAMRMDFEQDDFDFSALESLEKMFKEPQGLSMTVEEAEAEHGMPWTSSIDTRVEDDELLYMPFWNWHMDFLKENLTNLRVMPCTNDDTDFSYNVNEKKKARIVSMCLSSDEYRKIRLTYYDAGDNTQVYNAVLYPDPKYNLPVLGIDLLAFNRKKFLSIVDFQPLHEDEKDHALPFEGLLEPIKEKYETLKGRMSSKFYDETKFFSQQMLFARFEDEEVISRDLFPAFQSYVQTHLDLIRTCEPDAKNTDAVMERQKEYDIYSAERDPATGLFAAMYGNDWAQGFVHDFLFSMSERKEGAVAPPMPFMGGPPQQGGGGRNPMAQQKQPAQQTEKAEVVRRR